MIRLSATLVEKTKKPAKKTILITVSLILALMAPFSLANISRADSFDEKIKAIEKEIAGYQKQSKALNKKADTLQNEIARLEKQQQIIQKQINLKQAEHDRLVARIAENEARILQNREALGETITELYLANDISPLEMLASSQNIAEYVDKQAYRNTVRDNIIRTIDDIKRLKELLEEQKKGIERVLAERKFARDALNAKKAERANLIAQTRGEQSVYLNLISDRQERKAELQKQQQEAIEAAILAAGGLVSVLPGDPNKGGYPWEAGCWVDSNAWSHGGANGNGADPLGYGCRQCVSYTAWRVGQHTGSFPYFWGNANQWPASARSAGIETGTTPRVNSVGVISAGTYGHVVWVEAVNGDGTVDVSQYNYYNAGGAGWGHYSKMRVNASSYDTYIYF